MRLTPLIMLAAMLSWTTGCDRPQAPKSELDTKAEAEKKNEEKFTDKSMEQDAEFLVDAYSDGMAEISLSERAKDKATTQEARELAAMMVRDHQRVNKELKALAETKQVSLPSELTSRQSNHITRVCENTGRKFDEEYVEDLISAHKDAISLFEKAAAQANDPAIRNFFSDKLPDLRMHLDHAQKVKDQLGKNM